MQRVLTVYRALGPLVFIGLVLLLLSPVLSAFFTNEIALRARQAGLALWGVSAVIGLFRGAGVLWRRRAQDR